MADGTNVRSTLEGLYKVVYPSGIENAIPDQTILLGELPFTQIGETFKQPVSLTLPGGATYGGVNDTSTGGTAYDLGESLPSYSKKLNVEGYQFTLRETIGYGAAKAAKGGKECFKAVLGHVFDGMNLMANRRVEMDILDGQSYTGQGVVSSTSTSGSDYTFVVSAATWAPGRWIASYTHRIEAVYPTGGTPGAIPYSTVRANSGTAAVKSVNFATREVNYGTTALTSLAQYDIIFWSNLKASDGSTRTGQWTGTAWNSCLGMIPAVGMTGTVWGQDNTSFELIRGCTQSAGSTDLSFDTCGDALAQLWVKGATGPAVMLCSGTTWNNLISPEIALRRHDSSYKPEKVTVGNDAIEFRHLTGKLTIKPHPFMKEGEALIYFPKLWERVGSSEITFEQDVGGPGKKIFLHTANKNGFELRCFSDQSPFTRRLGYSCYIDNIVNS
jgi:hypothetical protein